MAIRVKITPMGGYIIGDGNIPNGLNPDQFMTLFAARIFEAQRAGLEEFGLTDEEVNATINQEMDKFNETMDAAPVREFRDNMPVHRLLEEVIDGRFA